MKVLRPDYYEEFECIADKCPFTCCQEWKIGVDEAAYNRWKTKQIPNETIVRNNIIEDTLDKYVKYEDGDRSISLCSNGLCPYLNEHSLCDIVLTYGEDEISTTCHTYPREEHKYKDYREDTLAIGCPAVLDLIWKQKDFKVTSFETNIDDKENNPSVDEEYVKLRDYLINVFDESKSIELNLKMLFYIMLDCFDNESTDVSLYSYDFLCELKEKIKEVKGDYEDTVIEQNELFLDMVDNYRKKKLYLDIIEPLSKLASEYEDEKSDELLADRCEFDGYINKKAFNDKSFSGLMNLLIKEEIYSTLYLPDGDLYSMTMKLQWIAITYSVILQALFLSWKLNGDLELEELKRIIVVVIRMTGYSEEDIEEYMEACFQDIIWEWGYMSLIMGQND